MTDRVSGVAGFGIPGVKSDGIFGPPPDDYTQPEAADDLRAACEWFKSFMQEGEWHRRRVKVANRFYQASTGAVDASDEGKFYVEEDTFGWYLFLCEALLEHPWNYDPAFGSRVVPLFIVIGRNLPLLQKVTGAEARVRDFVTKNRGQPNGGLFELLVAATYARAGGRVSFRSEKPGQARSHDMDVTIRGKAWAIECKRMEVSDYGNRERMIMRELWEESCSRLTKAYRSVITNIEFHVEVKNIPKDYMTRRTSEFLSSQRDSQIWSDEVASASIGQLDLKPLQTVLKTRDILQTSSEFYTLLIGKYVSRANLVWILNAKFQGGNRYVDECDFAAVLNWQCTADASTSAKARPITNHLAKAVTQLPKGVPSIIHIAFESVDGDRVEAVRYAKIIEAVNRFDPGEANVEYVYCHYLAPEAPPNELFAYDETVQWLALRPKGLRPLEIGEVVVAPDVSWKDGRHWEPS